MFILTDDKEASKLQVDRYCSLHKHSLYILQGLQRFDFK